MLSKEENFLSMAKATNLVLERHKSKWVNVKRFALAAKELQDDLGIMNEASARTEIETTGATIDKHTAGFQAVALGVKLAKRASIYAMDQKNMQLHDQLRVSRSSLISRHDSETIAKLRDIYKRISPIVAELQDYSVVNADVQLLKQLTDEYEKIEVKPRDLITERKTMNGLIPLMLTKIRTVLYSLDSLINIFDATPFEADYLNARKIIDLGGRYNKPDDGAEPTPPAE